MILPDWPIITEKEAEDGVYSPPPLQRGDLVEMKREGIRKSEGEGEGEGEGRFGVKMKDNGFIIFIFILMILIDNSQNN